MNTAAWDDLREEVCTQLEMGAGLGETELDTMTRLIWLERLYNSDAIEKAVAEALARERGVTLPKARVLQWKQPVRSSNSF